MKLTDEQLDHCVEWGMDNYGLTSIKDAMRAVGLKMLALAAEPQPAVPETPNRTGQWFVDAHGSSKGQIFGPITHTGDWVHWNNVEGGIAEAGITNGAWLRIPPPPAGQDLKGWECREPVGDEDYCAAPGYNSTTSPGAPNYGQRRWIPPQPAPTPWPRGPFEVCPHGPPQSRCYLRGADGVLGENITAAGAKAIKLALKWVPRAAALMTEDARQAPTNSFRTGSETYKDCQKRDALLAEIKAAGVEMPAGEER